MLKSLSKLGIMVRGSARKKRMSSAKAANLKVCWEMEIPLMSWFDLRRRSRGSKVRTTIKGERGHPCLVPLKSISCGREESVVLM